MSLGSYIPFYDDDAAEPDASAASPVVCLLSLHLLAETTLVRVLSSAVPLSTSSFSLVYGRIPSYFVSHQG